MDLLIYAEGLMKWRIFTNGEYMVNGPTVKLIENGEEEFCDIGNVYHCFKADYTNSDIKEVSVKKTDYWPWLPRGFDKEKAKNSAGLPQMITFRLSNDHDLSLYGLDDDFVIKLLQAPK